MKYLRLIVEFIGIVSSAVIAIFTLAEAIPDGFIANLSENWRLSVATVAAPEGYIVSPASMEVVIKNTEFVLNMRQSKLLLRDKKIPITLTDSKNYPDELYLSVDGKDSFTLELGEERKISGSSCNILLYQLPVDLKSGSFMLRCP